MKYLMIFLLFFVAGLPNSAQDRTDGAINTNTPKVSSKTVPVKTGDIAPDFTLKNHNGATVTLSESGSPAIIVFYRGHW